MALTDSFGNLVDQYSYDLWGVPAILKENVPQPLLYGGYVYDYEISWYWLSTRSYDPVLERFISPDPSQPGSRSYVYAGDDPLDVTDPTGQLGICIGPLTVGDCSDNPDPVKVAAGGILIGSAVALTALAVAGDVFFPPSAGANPGEATAATALVASGLAYLRAGVAVASAYSGYTSARVLMSSGGGASGGEAAAGTTTYSSGDTNQSSASSEEAPPARRTYQTYTKTNARTGQVYVGRTSGFGEPIENLIRRDSSHEYNDLGFGPALLDQTSENYWAIRGREQHLIEYYRGQGLSPGQINGISPRNPNLPAYLQAALDAFGSIP